MHRRKNLKKKYRSAIFGYMGFLIQIKLYNRDLGIIYGSLFHLFGKFTGSKEKS